MRDPRDGDAVLLMSWGVGWLQRRRLIQVSSEEASSHLRSPGTHAHQRSQAGCCTRPSMKNRSFDGLGHVAAKASKWTASAHFSCRQNMPMRRRCSTSRSPSPLTNEEYFDSIHARTVVIDLTAGSGHVGITLSNADDAGVKASAGVANCPSPASSILKLDSANM